MPILWTTTVYSLLLDAVKEELTSTGPEKEREGKADTFYATPWTTSDDIPEFFKKVECDRQKCIDRFNKLMEKEKVVGRPQLSVKMFNSRVREALADVAKCCRECKDPKSTQAVGLKACEKCYCKTLDTSHCLKKETAFKAWVKSADESGKHYCFYTGVEITLSVAQLDHIKPQSKFPELRSEPSNLCFAHASINKAKGDMDAAAFVDLMLLIVTTATPSHLLAVKEKLNPAAVVSTK